MKRRLRLITACIVLSAVVIWFGSTFFIKASDSRIEIKGLTVHVADRPFTGVAFEFHPTGYPSFLAFYWRGLKTLTEWQWYPDGGLWSQEQFWLGVQHGESRMWYPDGKVKRWASYKNGERDGKFIGWHSNGQISDYNFYENGRELTHKSWVSDGVPFYNYVYQDGQKVGMSGGDFCKRIRPPAQL